MVATATRRATKPATATPNRLHPNRREARTSGSSGPSTTSGVVGEPCAGTARECRGRTRLALCSPPVGDPEPAPGPSPRRRAPVTGSSDRSFARIVLAVGSRAAPLRGRARLAVGRPAPPRTKLGRFYDAQAHSLLQGHWYVDPNVAGIEGYDVKGHAQIYFGPVPAVVRMPLVAIASRFDGRLTRVSLLLAELLLIVALARLTVWVGRFLLGNRPRGPGLAFLAAVNVLAIATSVPLLLTSNAWGTTRPSCGAQPWR